MMLTAHFDIYGFPECDYHVKLKVGDMPMNVVLDTGSSNTAVISDQCTHTTCVNTVQPPYLPVDPTALVNPVNASYGNAKMRASWQGYATGQVVDLGKNHTVYARVDVITGHHHFFVDRCPHNQGLWGLAYPALQTRPRFHHFNHDRQHTPSLQTLLDAAHAQRNIPDVFTYQLCAPAQVDPAAVQGMAAITKGRSTASFASRLCEDNRVGHFWLGGYPSKAIQSSEIVWVPLTRSHYYEVSIDHFMVNGVPVPMDDTLNHPRTIVDTGSKDIILSQHNLDRFLETLWQTGMIVFDKTFVPPEYEEAFWLRRAQLALPADAIRFDRSRANIAVQFSGQAIDIPIDNLIRVVPIDSPPGWVNVSLTGLSHGGGSHMAGTVLGNTLLRGKTTIWDRAGGRIGFAASNPAMCCASSFAEDVDVFLSPSASNNNNNNNNSGSIDVANSSYNHRHTLIMQSFFMVLMIASILCTGLHLGWILLTKHREQQQRYQHQRALPSS